MTATGRIISYILTGLLLAWIIILASHLYEEKVEIETGLQGEADTYPLLAAERFLTQMGIPVQRIENPEQITTLPGPQDALLITTDRQTIGIELTDQLLAWVKN